MLRWAIFGTGFISHKVIETIAASDGSKVTLIAGRTPKAVAAFQTQHAIPRTTLNYDDALSDPDVDVVYIACQTKCITH